MCNRLTFGLPWSAKIRPERQEGTQAFVEYGVADVHPAVRFLSHCPGSRELFSFTGRTAEHIHVFLKSSLGAEARYPGLTCSWTRHTLCHSISDRDLQGEVEQRRLAVRTDPSSTDRQFAERLPSHTEKWSTGFPK